MCVEKLYWFQHNNKLGQYSAAKVHDFVKVKYIVEDKKAKDTLEDYQITINKPEDLICEEYDGI